MSRRTFVLFLCCCIFGGMNLAWPGDCLSQQEKSGSTVSVDKVPSVQQLQSWAKEHFAIPETDAGLPGVGPIRRYDWFKNLWQQRRSQWAKDAAKDQGAVVFLGDSITQGWGEDFRGDFGKLAVANRGISGDTTRGMLLRLSEDVLSLNPKATVILAGTNDLEEKATAEQVVANMPEIVDRLHQHNESMPVVLCLVFPSSATKARPKDKIQAINRLYREALKGRDYVTVIDTWTLFADSQGDAIGELFPDLLHPNQHGYAKWKQALLPYLETLELVSVADSEGPVLEPEFVSLFNGKNLDGWSYQPSTDQDRKTHEGWKAADPNAPDWPMLTEVVSHDGETETPDRRYRVRHGRLVVCYPPEGRKIQQIWTQQVFEGDFTLRLEFRAMPDADSGVFVCGKQLQCRDFLRAGPYKNLQKYNDLDWNHLEVVVKDGKARCTCNGEVLEEAWDVPASGRIGLEADRNQMEYRRIRIRKD